MPYSSTGLIMFDVTSVNLGSACPSQDNTDRYHELSDINADPLTKAKKTKF